MLGQDGIYISYQLGGEIVVCGIVPHALIQGEIDRALDILEEQARRAPIRYLAAVLKMRDTPQVPRPLPDQE